MPEHDSYTPDPNQANTNYELSDVQIPVLIRFGIGLVIFVALASGISMLIYTFLTRLAEEPINAHYKTVIRQEAMKPPEGTPLLQERPVIEIRDFRRKEETEMTEYAHMSAGGTRIPVERAMHIAVDKGLNNLKFQKEGEPMTSVKPTPEMKLKAPPPTSPTPPVR